MLDDDDLIATLEKKLLQTRDEQNRKLVRLREAESDVELLRIEINALENSAAQTAKEIETLVGPTPTHARSLGKSARIEDDLDTRRRAADRPVNRKEPQPRTYQRDNSVAYLHQSRGIASINHFEPVSNRFNDRTITQACTLLLREANMPLHVNELYDLLIAGGMKFNGNNPTISIAVSLNRNRRFRKVNPGTFDLVIREAIQAAS